MVYVIDAGPARRVAYFESSVKFYLTVITAAVTVYLSTSQQPLETPLGGTAQGLAFTSADGPQLLDWIGPVWIIASANNTEINLELLGA